MESALGKTGINNTQSSSPSAETATNMLRLDSFITPFIYSIYFRLDQVDTGVSRLSSWLGSRQHGHWVTTENKPSFHWETICFLPPFLLVIGAFKQELRSAFGDATAEMAEGWGWSWFKNHPGHFFLKKIILFVYLFLAALGLHCFCGFL